MVVNYDEQESAEHRPAGIPEDTGGMPLKKAVYTNISTTFSGIGYVIVDMNGLVESALSQYTLRREEIPAQTVFWHACYLLESLKKASLGEQRLLYEEASDVYLGCILKILRKALTKSGLLDEKAEVSAEELDEVIENDRIALLMTVSSREKLTKYCKTRGIYVGMLETLTFEIPFAYCNVAESGVELREVKYEATEAKGKAKSRAARDILDEYGVNIEKIEMEFLGEHPAAIKEVGCVEIEIVEAVAYGDDDVPLFDGRIRANGVQPQTYIPKEPTKIWSVPDKPWCGEDLELNMVGSIEKINQRHIENICRSAKSMYDGHDFSRTRPKKAAASEPTSKKSQKIKEMNRARLKAKEKAEEVEWLANFYAGYKRLKSFNSRRALLEKTKTDKKSIRSMVMLLKIELYEEQWNTERHSAVPDERVLVPLYLTCVEYVKEFAPDINVTKVNTSDYSEREKVLHVLKTLGAVGFGATAKELAEAHGISGVEGSAALSDVDLYFQMKYLGEHLPRTLRSRKDERVSFDPDGWQIELLDAVDAGHSAVVAAPTSSGKTFICFYAIEKVLRESLIDVVIFCLPTKALVNQVSADIYARFGSGDAYPSANGRVLQGTLMRDKSTETFNCRVLITVPEMLESLLGSRECENVRWLIIDEVHKINDPALGASLERAIHMARAPLLLLSATIGNLRQFYGWVARVEADKGRRCVLVTHRERFCELQLHLYAQGACRGVLLSGESNALLSGDGNHTSQSGTAAKSRKGHANSAPDSSDTNSFAHRLIALNSMFAYSHEHLLRFGFGNDLHFLPHELLNLYYYIYHVLAPEDKRRIRELAPRRFFRSNLLTKADVSAYEAHLLATVEAWIAEGVLARPQISEIYTLLLGDAPHAFPSDYSEEYLAANILGLLDILKEQNLLPVIVFNTDRERVSRLAARVTSQLDVRDAHGRKDRAAERARKEAKRARDAEQSKDAWIEASIAAEQTESRDITHTFLDPVTRLTDAEVAAMMRDAAPKQRELLGMAYRGIGVHHGGLGRHYRSAVEILFRQRHVRVLFATDTLALGVNMPCRTVVFAGDSLRLDPMNFRQMAGRAGRRGYDTLGHVVFMGIPRQRIQNLLVSRLPEVRGSYVLSNASLVGGPMFVSLQCDCVVARPLLGEAGDAESGHAQVDSVSATQADSVSAAQTDAYTMQLDAHTGTHEAIEAAASLARLSISNSPDTTYSLPPMSDRAHREALRARQLSRYPFCDRPSYLWDLFAALRAADPGVYVFGLLVDRCAFAWREDDVALVVAHFFEVIPHCAAAVSLPPLPPACAAVVDAVNVAYREDLAAVLPPRLRVLDGQSARPLFYLKSFVYAANVPKNSYIYDFFRHGSAASVAARNGVSCGDLWRALGTVDRLCLTLCKVLERSHGEDDDRCKKMCEIYRRFRAKYRDIFA